MFVREVYVYNECPIYSDRMLPYVSPYGSEDCCTIGGAKRALKKADKNSVKYVKAKMTLHMPLTIEEMVRLLTAQKNANGYAGKKNFNVLNGVLDCLKNSIIA